MNNLPLIAVYNVYNEAEYLEYSLKSIYDHVDQIVIIEGAYLETYQTNGGQQRSTDGTIEIIENFPDPDQKIKVSLFIKEGLSQLPQRNVALQLLKDVNCWFWIVDGDEVYKPEDLEKLKNILGETDADGIKINSFTFINDFNHFAPIAFPRLFRLRQGHFYHFVAPNNLAKDGRAVPIKSYEDDVAFYHYSYCKSNKRFMEKKKEREKLGREFTWKLNEEGKVCKTTTGKMGIDFKGTHPNIMKAHPLWPQN